MKFLLPNYSCLQNPWLGGYRPPDPRSLCLQLNLLNPPWTKFLGTPLNISLLYFWGGGGEEEIKSTMGIRNFNLRRGQVMTAEEDWPVSDLNKHIPVFPTLIPVFLFAHFNSVARKILLGKKKGGAADTCNRATNRGVLIAFLAATASRAHHCTVLYSTT